MNFSAQELADILSNIQAREQYIAKRITVETWLEATIAFKRWKLAAILANLCDEGCAERTLKVEDRR